METRQQILALTLFAMKDALYQTLERFISLSHQKSADGVFLGEHVRAYFSLVIMEAEGSRKMGMCGERWCGGNYFS